MDGHPGNQLDGHHQRGRDAPKEGGLGFDPSWAGRLTLFIYIFLYYFTGLGSGGGRGFFLLLSFNGQLPAGTARLLCGPATLIWLLWGKTQMLIKLKSRRREERRRKTNFYPARDGYSRLLF